MQPIRLVEPGHVPAPIVDLKPGMTWWQQLLFLLVSAAIAGGSSWAGSHWGGVTNDQLTKALDEREARLGKKIDDLKGAVAKDSDDMRKYVDLKTAPVAKVTQKRPKKKTNEPAGGTLE